MRLVVVDGAEQAADRGADPNPSRVTSTSVRPISMRWNGSTGIASFPPINTEVD